jgi:uncharacterized repeat protein (TIGR03803 family)
MRTRKRFAHGLVIGVSMFICMTSLLANPSYSQSAYSILYNFAGGGTDGLNPYGSLTLSGSTLYGMTYDGPQAAGPPGYHDPGTVFKINPDGTGYQILHYFNPTAGDGTGPFGDVTLVGSKLYGMTYIGGSSGDGVIFSCQIPQSDTGMLQLLLLN